MKLHSKEKSIFLILTIAVTYQLSAGQAEARRVFGAGPRGTMTAYASSGQNGSRAGARAWGRNAGGGVSGGQYTGPNGGTFGRAGAFGYQRGVGAGRVGGWNSTGPNGGSASGRVQNRYNAQTNTGNRDVNVAATGAKGGQYGYTKDTTYGKGEGYTSTIDTDHHGDYSVNYAPGATPVITPVQ